MFDTLGCLLVEAAEATFGSGRSEGTVSRGRLTEGPRSTSLPANSGPSSWEGDSPAAARPLANRSLGGKPLVNWVVRRASEAQLLQGLVVILPAGSGLEAFKATLPSGVAVFESEQSDRLGRLADCLEAFPARGVVNLRLDCPLLDPCLVDRLVRAAGPDTEVDYATYRSEERPARNRLQALLCAQLGLFAEYIRADVVRQLDASLTHPPSRQNFSSHLMAHPESFVLRLVSLPRDLDRDDLRLSLRHQDDWDHAEQIIEALGDDALDWQRIVALLQRQPHLRKRMADLNQADLNQLAH
jgi:spore coat polysaccharide biosynthesis protein SpsF